jgi:ribonuclease HI
MKIVELEFDGGYGNNIATFGYRIRCNGMITEGCGSYRDPKMTNNIAEYLGLLKGIQRVKKEVSKPFELMIYGDSRLVIETVGKRWGWSKKKRNWDPHRHVPYLKTMLDKVFKRARAIELPNHLGSPRQKYCG